MMRDGFGVKLRELRQNKGMTLRALAEAAGVDFTYLSKIENDRLVPSASAILALAAELEGNSDELLALAGKAPADVGDMLQKSQGARMFFRSAMSTNLSEEDWKKLLQDIPKKKK